MSDKFIGILPTADTHIQRSRAQICFIEFTHSSTFIFLCGITHRIVVLDDKGFWYWYSI